MKSVIVCFPRCTDIEMSALVIGTKRILRANQDVHKAFDVSRNALVKSLAKMINIFITYHVLMFMVISYLLLFITTTTSNKEKMI